jgi:hypothetical protein
LKCKASKTGVGEVQQQRSTTKWQNTTRR